MGNPSDPRLQLTYKRKNAAVSVNTCHRVLLTDMNAFIVPLERAVLNLAHGETAAEIQDSQRDRPVIGRPSRRQSRSQAPHSSYSCWDGVPKPGAPSPPQQPPSLKLAQDESGERGTVGTTHRGPLHLCAQAPRASGDGACGGQRNLREAPSSTSAAFPPSHPRELEPGCLRGEASNSPGQLWLLGMSPGQLAHSYPPESEQPGQRLSQSRGSCGGCCSGERPGWSPGPLSLLTPHLFFSLFLALALR